MQTQSIQTAVRVVLGEKTRQIRLAEHTVACLTKSVADRFSVPATLTFGYVDDQKDFVQVRSDQELVLALNQLQRKLRIIATQAVEALVVLQPPTLSTVSQLATPEVVKPLPPNAEACIFQRSAGKAQPAIPNPEFRPDVAVQSSPAKEDNSRPTPADVHSVSDKQPAKRAAKLEKVKNVSLKPKSLRLASQFYLVKGTQDKLEKRRLVIAPADKFTKVWKFRNESTEAWPEDTRLTFVQGEQEALKVPTSTRVNLFNLLKRVK